MRGSPPLRFLAIVLGGWAALRTALVAPPWSTPPPDSVAAAVPIRAGPAPRTGPGVRKAPSPERAAASVRRPLAIAVRPPRRPSLRRAPPAPAARPFTAMPGIAPPGRGAATAAVPPFPMPPAAFPPSPVPASKGRWALSAWAFVRRGDPAPLAAAGLLGGSQAGARLAFRLNRDSERPLALSVRLSAPLRRPAGAEAALGASWRPSRRLPVHILAERRQALGPEGRSAFALTAHGGIGEAPLGPFRIDAYAQAGLVGAGSRDPFGDGSIRLSLPLGDRARLGAGAWAAAQPGLARLDLGPQATLRLPVGGRAVTVAADWRLRIAGNAAPGSGPTLTLGTDF